MLMVLVWCVFFKPLLVERSAHERLKETFFLNDLFMLNKGPAIRVFISCCRYAELMYVAVAVSMILGSVAEYMSDQVFISNSENLLVLALLSLSLCAAYTTLKKWV